MKIVSQLTDAAIAQELGRRIEATRLAINLTQAALAKIAGISKRTLERIESGEVATQLTGFLRVCRALGLLDRFDLLVPEPTISPLEQLKLQRKKRQRASQASRTSQSRQQTASGSDIPRTSWTWDDSP